SNTFFTPEEYLNEVQNTISQQVAENRNKPYALELCAMVEKRLVAHLIKLAADENISERVRALAYTKLIQMDEDLYSGERDVRNAFRNHQVYLDRQIRAFLANPKDVEIPAPISLPDGSPIGCSGLH
ncbi:MAG: hypothetical protein AAGA62_01940, partial [Bacteroidota bacterium]